MAMAPKLQVKQSQSLVMTPQLQQAIKLLQLTNIELSAFVEEQLESNPLLERGTGTENRRGERDVTRDADGGFDEVKLDSPSAAAHEMDAPDHALNSDASPGDHNETQKPADVGGAVDWSKARTGGSFNGSGDYDMAANVAAEKTLSEVIGEQIIHAFPARRDQLIALYLTDHVDENGYLRLSLEDAASNLGTDMSAMIAILGTLQTFEPVGVFARSLQECLAMQLAERGDLDVSMQAILDNLDLLARHDLSKLASKSGLDAETLRTYIQRLKALSPKPGLAYGDVVAATVEPDVFIRETPNGGWAVELNSDTLPRVLVNNRYFSEICGPDSKLKADEATKTFMTECHQNASWLVKSLDQRARTILKVSTEIVRQQDGFFAYGIDHMRPLNLRTVAEAIDMHESTVSRVTSNKYMSTPRGVFELKYFFTASIPALEGAEAHSAEAVRHKIKILVGEETAGSVKSDDKIVNLLRAQGIDIARRTVAKYRESMGIPSSVERRRIFKHKSA